MQMLFGLQCSFRRHIAKDWSQFVPKYYQCELLKLLPTEHTRVGAPKQPSIERWRGKDRQLPEHSNTSRYSTTQQLEHHLHKLL